MTRRHDRARRLHESPPQARAPNIKPAHFATVLGARLALLGLTVIPSCEQGGDQVNNDNNSPCASIPNALLVALDADECLQLMDAGHTLNQAAVAYQVTLNARGLPAEISVGAAHLALTWADDASSLSIVITEGGESQTIELAIDLTDSGLLDTLEEYEARTGNNASSLRDYIAAYPGFAHGMATGADPRGQARFVELGADKPRRATAQHRPAFRNMREYIDALSDTWFAPAVWARQ